MNQGIIIQARASSTRLPKKILLPFFESRCILQWQITRLLGVFPKEKIIIATSTNEADDAVMQIGEELQIKVYRGDENDVLQRFISCASTFELTEIIRLCSDNVFIDILALQQLWNTTIDELDYLSFLVDGTPSIKTHFGLWAEKTTLYALKEVKKKTKNPLYREHVTNFIYTHPNDFRIQWIPLAIKDYRNIRLTTDTVEDFEIHQLIFKELFEKHKLNFTTQHIFEVLDRYPELKQRMSLQIVQNEK